MNRVKLTTGTLFLLATACGAPDEGATEETDIETQALGEASCLTATPDAELTAPAWHFSPTIYSNPKCTKAFVYSIPGAFPEKGFFEVNWADEWARNRTQCRNGSTTVQVLSRTRTGLIPVFFTSEGSYSAPLFWDSASSVCWYPRLTIMDTDEGGTTGRWEYRAAAFMTPPRPSIPNDGVTFALPRSLVGRSVRLAAQNLTPSGTTQPLRAMYDVRHWPL